ncbi:MAG: LysM peptidoglycan-binding domain-containing protein [Litorimonas sp.]
MRFVILSTLALSIAGANSAAASADPTDPDYKAAVEAQAERIRAYRRAVIRQGSEAPADPAQSPSKTLTVETETDTRSHIVVKKDTLFSLSKRYGVSVSALQKANGLAGSAISLGQSLVIPAKPAPTGITVVIEQESRSSNPVSSIVGETSVPKVYAVVKRDSLFAIARRTCLSVDSLASANALSAPYVLQPGQRLTLPDGHCLTR